MERESMAQVARNICLQIQFKMKFIIIFTLFATACVTAFPSYLASIAAVMNKLEANSRITSSTTLPPPPSPPPTQPSRDTERDSNLYIFP